MALTWKCSSCSSTNTSNRNINPCNNCYVLESDNNLKRARELYILGNIGKPYVCFIPLKIPFFIYPLSAPMVKYSLQYKHGHVLINFEAELWDNRHSEYYHIESIKIDLNKKNFNESKSFFINSKSPYCNKFSLLLTEPYVGVYSVEISAKCLGAQRISPKQRLVITIKLRENININKWYFKDDYEIFRPSYQNISRTICQLSIGERKTVSCQAGTYSLHKTAYNECTQTNLKTNKIRKLKLNYKLAIEDVKCNINTLQFVSHMSYDEALSVKVGSRVDVRDIDDGYMYTATVHDIKDTGQIKIVYDALDATCPEWIDILDESYRLAKYKSISARARHRLKQVKIGDYINVNPIHFDPGWKCAVVIDIDSKSGQIGVKWDKNSDEEYWIHSDNTKECAKFDTRGVKALFFATVLTSKYKIMEVVDISNKNNMNIYESILRGKCKEAKIESWKMERYLFHGIRSAGVDALQKIIKNGFDRSYNKVGIYGKGTYFAKNASYSVEGGYCGKDRNGLYFILLCRVLVGEYIVGEKSIKTIPTKEDGTEYDSLVDSIENPTIFVSWRDYHAIPHYLIKFKCV